MITDAQVEKALQYLADTDEELGRLVGECEGLSHRIKTAKAMAYLDAFGTVGERQARADCDAAVVELIDSHQNAVADRETIRAKRKRAELTVDVWRTQQASSRRGHV